MPILPDTRRFGRDEQRLGYPVETTPRRWWDDGEQLLNATPSGRVGYQRCEAPDGRVNSPRCCDGGGAGEGCGVLECDNHRGGKRQQGE